MPVLILATGTTLFLLAALARTAARTPAALSLRRRAALRLVAARNALAAALAGRPTRRPTHR